MFLCSLESRKNNPLGAVRRRIHDTCLKITAVLLGLLGLFFISSKLGLSLFVFLCACLIISESNHFPGSALFSLHIFMSAEQ